MRFPSAIATAALAASLCTLIPAASRAQSPARPWLGVALDAPSPGAGVRVGHVVRGSPAYTAGIREGDRLLTVAGATVASGADVVHAVATRSVGDMVEISFQHAGGPRTVRATLASFPAQDQMLRMDLIGAAAPAWGPDLAVVSGVVPSSLVGLRGRVVVLDFWATWCAPCRVSLPHLDDLQRRYAGSGLSVVGVSSEDAPIVASFVREMPVHYGVVADPDAHMPRAFGVVSLPTLVLIDKRGVVREVAVGYDPANDGRLESMIQALLAEPAPAN